jgi:hypothetical protein
MYGKIQRLSATVRANFPGVERNCRASRSTSKGEQRIPATVKAARIAAKEPSALPTKARASSSLLLCATSA